MSDNLSDSPGSSLYKVKLTPYGGRGVFATRFIPKDTLIHVCPAPYAYLVYRIFRKEVCAWCFAYCLDSTRSSWNVKIGSASDGSAKGGLWFCCETCKAEWIKEEDLDGAASEALEALDREARRLGNRSGKAKPTKSTSGDSNVFETLVPAKAEDVTPESIESAWKEIEARVALKGARRSNRIHDSLQNAFDPDSDLDAARLITSALVKRYLEDQCQPSSTRSPYSYSALAELQNNEINGTRHSPSSFAQALRTFAFLNQALPPASPLLKYVESSETTRCVLARDAGNSFGIWQVPYMEESEMFGWGIYVSASYFNHSCAPNVAKDRQGRQFRFATTRDVQMGEELRISYGHVEDDVIKRKARLKENWYFECGCGRCDEELKAAGATEE